MKSSFLLLAAFLLLLFSARAKAQEDDMNSVPGLFGIEDTIYVHTSAKLFPSGKTYLTNGLVINTPDGYVLVDTPWNDEQTQNLINEIQKRFHKKIILAYITQARDDKMGGIKTLLANKIRVLSNIKTSKAASILGFPSPEPVFSEDTVLNFNGNIFIELFYPGVGISNDNSVVWLPQTRILYGGNLVKSYEDQDIGNLAGANIKEWAVSLKKIIDRFKDPQMVIPGHNPWAQKDFLLKYTLKLIEDHIGKK